MKKILTLMLSLVLALSLAGCGKDDKIVNLGLLMVPNDAILAKEMGLFEEKFGAAGYEVNYQIFDSGTSANTAIVTGDTDFATMGNINGLVALGRNMDAELVWIHETLGAIEALAVKKSLNVESPEQLAGLSIATPFSSTAHYVLLNVLKEAGVEDEVNLLNMTTPSIVAAWGNNAIDAAYTWQPSLGLLLADDGEVLVDSEDMIAKGYMTANIELARKSFAKENPELVQIYIECMHEANEYFNSNREDAIQKLAAALDITAEDVELQVNGSIWTSVEDMQSEAFIEGYVNTMYEQTIFLKDQELLDRVVDRVEVDTFINNTYALEVE